MLAIETSTSLCTIAAGTPGNLIEIAYRERHQLSTKIGNWANEVLEKACLQPSELDIVLVGRGPGSWTGLRIGISFARAFAWAAGISCGGVPSSDATAGALCHETADVIFFAAASRARELWVAKFDVSDGTVRKVQHETTVDLTEFIQMIDSVKQSTIICGEASGLIEAQLGSRRTVPQVRFVSNGTTAVAVAKYGLDRIGAGESLVSVSPIYASPSQAERNIGIIVTASE